LSVNRGIARQKGESAEEKRCRKNAIKREREMARIQKKKTREIFQEEFQKRSIDVMSDDIAGKSVFRYA
jgi:protein LTV1